MLAYILVAIGSALGGMGRYLVSGIVTTATGGTFPYGTMLVNITGCLVIGFFATLTGPDGRLLVGTPARQFVMVGLCGGYTTFSSFSLETLYLMRAGEFIPAATNALGSVVLCLVSVWLGYALAAALNRGV
ncbi:MAG TPA: fluoride efflux transporter CrcB [Candidatus Acidoferrales bacterium]|nr:fluoride efflux transporter CrcB [Candidatus Acidoferrales bacterium]